MQASNLGRRRSLLEEEKAARPITRVHEHPPVHSLARPSPPRPCNLCHVLHLNHVRTRAPALFSLRASRASRLAPANAASSLTHVTMAGGQVAMTIVLVLLLLLLVVVAAVLPSAPELASAGSTEVAGERRPPSLVPFRPRQHGGRRQPLFHGPAAGGCMPRGFRVPPSAPSRYVNYHTLDAGACAHGRAGKP